MVGHFVDTIKPYIDQFPNIYSRDLNPNNELSKDLINEIAESVGFTMPTVESSVNLVKTILGENSNVPLRDSVAELHKRKDAIKKSGIDVAIMSFSWFAIEKIKKMDPTIKTVMLLGDITNKITRRFTSAQVIGPSVEMIRKSPELISEIKNSGKELYVWTVDSTEDLQYCASVGVDIVMTNRPAHARSVLGYS